MQSFIKPLGLIAAALLIATLAACSGYLDRRDTIALSGGNAVATDAMTEMVDPWPIASADRNIPFNGQKMQSAVQRYRENKIPQPVGTETSADFAPPPAAPAANSGNSPNPVGPTVTQTN